jgi:hypothetical protein
MSTEGHFGKPPNKSRLLLLTLLAVGAGGVVTVGAIMPAEFGTDPLGIGQATGLSRLWAPPTVVYEPKAGSEDATPFRPTEVAYREDVVMIPVPNYFTGPYLNELEYKVRMQQGATITFTWTAGNIDLADDLYFEFHGHTLQNREEMTVASYHKDSINHSSGTLTAPFDGVHGWYFQNSSDKDAVIELHISGFYELVPPGEVGNLGRIVANVPVEEAVAPE